MRELTAVATTVARPAGGKVSDGLSMAVHVPAGTEIKAGDLVCLQARAGAGAYFVGTAFSDITTGDAETGTLVIDLAPGEVATQKLTEGESFLPGTPVWFDISTGLLTVSKKSVFVGLVSRAASSDATPTAYVLVASSKVEPAPMLETIADVVPTADADAADVAGASAAELVTDLNKVGGVVEVLNAVRADLNGEGGVVETLNAVVAALKAARILASS